DDAPAVAPPAPAPPSCPPPVRLLRSIQQPESSKGSAARRWGFTGAWSGYSPRSALGGSVLLHRRRTISGDGLAGRATGGEVRHALRVVRVDRQVERLREAARRDRHLRQDVRPDGRL